MLELLLREHRPVLVVHLKPNVVCLAEDNEVCPLRSVQFGVLHRATHDLEPLCVRETWRRYGHESDDPLSEAMQDAS